MTATCPVFIVLSDGDMRRALVKKLSALGYQPTPFVNGSDFVQSLSFLPAGVCIVDLDLPDMKGTAVLEDLLSTRRDIPLIMTSSTADMRTVVQVIKKGADDFIEQPFSDKILLATIEQACSLVPARAERHQEKIRAKNCLQSLTAREIDILQAAQTEADNRVIADRFHLTLRTVETYRARIMKKCGVRRFSEAVSMCSLVREDSLRS
ncbi:response regulator transcription factor [Sphingobium sp. EP60837]|nr:response regulator [Sphingobium sp. EP60837]ANI78659.1 C4-dicarboxylate transport transcriptional regulatory protein DctD [Sphingobium sp. EP60837]